MRILEQCDLCGESNFVTLFSARDRMHAVEGHFRIQRCAKCSLIFINPQPTMEELAAHYPRDGYYSLAAEPPKTDVIAKLAVRAPRSIAWLLSPLTVFLRSTVIVRGGRLLDVGCGAGHFVRLARELGMDAWGVEPSLDQSPDPQIFAGTLEAAQYPNDYFDVITINHVLEHVSSPTETLRELRRVLRPGGVLVVAVPQTDSLAYWLFGKHWVQLDVPRHLYAFSVRTLRRYAEKEDLRILTVRYNSRPFQFLGSVLYWASDLAGQERFLAASRFHKRLSLNLAALPLTYLANLFHLGDQAEILMTK
jgi:2-polyprenyl-3-methyl-5-hydroxy-6-metoxy-1,4-benzoquinol methylase